MALTNEVKQLEAVLNNVRRELELAAKAVQEAEAKVAEAIHERDRLREERSRLKKISRSLEISLRELKEINGGE